MHIYIYIYIYLKKSIPDAKLWNYGRTSLRED